MHRQLNNTDQPASVASLAGSTASQASVEIKGVCKSYGEEWEQQDVIKDLTLDILPGKLTVVVGPSGCGKSTLVNLIAGFERPDRGEILLNGRRVTGPSKDRMVVFQETALIPWQTTYQNVVFGPKLRGDIKGKALYQRAHELLTKVGLQDFMDKYPLQLSGGMQRRAELARDVDAVSEEDLVADLQAGGLGSGGAEDDFVGVRIGGRRGALARERRGAFA